MPIMGGVLRFCFNPCFIGLASATFDDDAVADEDWCFNPCFIGLASATFNPRPDDKPRLEFQSLFYWISLCNKHSGKAWRRLN